MTIVAGGCSFVWGSELKDCLHSGPNGYSKNTFTALLTEPYEYACVAYPGFGNDAIARNIINYCEENPNVKGVIVSWTFPGRYEFNFSDSNWQTINHWTIGHDLNPAHTDLVSAHAEKAKMVGVYDFALHWFKHIGSLGYWEIYHSLKEIVYLQNYLKVKQIPYMFTCADNILFQNETVQQQDQTIKSLISQIDMDKWFFFPAGTNSNHTMTPRGFYQWAVENKYKVGQTHPLEEAHADAAKLMKDKFNELVKKRLE